MEYEEYMSRIRDPYVRFCERDEANASPYSIFNFPPAVSKTSLLFINLRLRPSLRILYVLALSICSYS